MGSDNIISVNVPNGLSIALMIVVLGVLYCVGRKFVLTRKSGA